MPHKATRIKTIKQPLIMNYVRVYEVQVVDTIHVTHTLIPLQLAELWHCCVYEQGENLFSTSICH